jgi:hypothetical protein
MAGRQWGWRWAGVAAFQVLAALPLAAGPEVGPLVARIRAVGGEGAGNAEAARAWRELVRLGPDALPALLSALDDADPVAANWLRAAVDAIAERELAAGRPLPAGWRRSYGRRGTPGPPAGWPTSGLVRVDPSAPARLLPGMLHDPSTELRRDAVAVVLREARERLDGGEKRAATAAYRKALSGARDRDQVDLIAQQLRALGVEVDLADYFGFLRMWALLIKVCQNEQTEEWARAWSFQLRVCDPAGGKVPLTVPGEGRGR